MATPPNERFRRIAEKQRAVDAKMSRWFGIPELAARPAPAPGPAEPEQWGELERVILTLSETRPVSLRRLLRAYGEGLYGMAAGPGDPDEGAFIPATVIDGTEPVRLPSAVFAADAEAFLSGFGPGAAPARAGAVRFAHGAVNADPVNFPADEGWGLYCLADQPDSAGAERLEVFALRYDRRPASGGEPYDLIENGRIAAALACAASGGWTDAQLNALRLVAARRTKALIDEAVADVHGWLSEDDTYLVEKFETSGKRIVSGVIQDLGSRLLNRGNG